MAEVARIFAAFGIYPTGFYDLRDAKPQPVPVISTAFQPVDRDELAQNRFRVFTSMLVPEDRRFFNADLERRHTAFLGSRELFPSELLELADQVVRDDGLSPELAERFLELVIDAFAVSSEPVDREWYEELHTISSVAADIGGVTTTHINRLTPRVLALRPDGGHGHRDDRPHPGPPRWEGPDVLLRQTSFKAFGERRVFRNANGSLEDRDLRVRLAEVEARGIALTPAGRSLC